MIKGNIMKKTFFYLILFFSVSCQTNTSNEDKYLNLSLLDSKSKTQLNKIEIDTIFADFSFTYSGDIFWKLRDDSLYLFDRLMGTVDIYNKQGVFSRRTLGIGRGPGEVMEQIGTVCNFGKGWLLVDDYVMYYFSRDFDNKIIKNLFALDDSFAARRGSILKNPDPAKDIELYIPAYYVRPQMSLLKDGTILIKVSCDHPDYKERKYYRESAIIAKYNYDKGTISKLMGRYPPSYRTEYYTVAFPDHYYSGYKNGQFLLNFEIDSLIYVCDNNFDPQNAFGLSGEMINTDYKLTNSDGPTEINFQKEESVRGYYMTVYYSPNTDITLRTYKTGIKNESEAGKTNNPSRMQIYKGIDLVGDVPIPDNFEIIGYEHPYFYADGYFEIGEEKDKVGIYKFKLEL